MDTIVTYHILPGQFTKGTLQWNRLLGIRLYICEQVVHAPNGVFQGLKLYIAIVWILENHIIRDENISRLITIVFFEKMFGCTNITMHIMSQKVTRMMPLKSDVKKSIAARYWFSLSSRSIKLRSIRYWVTKYTSCEMWIYPKWSGILSIPFTLIAKHSWISLSI